MRIPREITSLLGSLFASKASAATGQKQRAAEGPSAQAHRPGAIDPAREASLKAKVSSGFPTDRVSLSASGISAANTLGTVASVRQDIPSIALPARTSHPADIDQDCSRFESIESDVKALLPVVADVPLQSRQQTPDAPLERETPETRRLVRAVYGPPESESGENLSPGTGIRIHV